MNNKNYFWVGGKHACLEIIKKNNRNIDKIYCTENFLSKYPFLKSKSEIQNYKKINRLFSNNNFEHQGIAVKVSEINISSITKEKKISSYKKLLILDNITDQRNIGSILRTALAFEIDGVIIDKRIFNQKNELMLKSAAGSFENIKVYITSNISNDIKFLKKNNFFVYGMDVNTSKYINNINFDTKFALVFGSEANGLKPIIKKNCDDLIKIKINKKIESLNVSNSVAAGLAIINSNR